MDRPGARFLDAVSLEDGDKAAALAWGERQGYVAAADLWRWTYWDDEMEEEMYQTFLCREEAIVEADCEDDDECVTMISGHVSTPALDHAAMQDRPSHGTNSVLDLLLPIYATQVLGLDGVWWNERLDPLRYSAPRGVIPAGAISQWRINPCDCDPD